MQELLSKAQLARRRGVSRQAVTVLTRIGGRLEPALVGGKLDAGHPTVVDYLAESPAAPPGGPSRDVEGAPDDGTGSALADVLEMRLGELMTRFGGLEAFTDWIRAGKLVEDWRTARLKNEETQGTLIPRDLVESHILALIEEQNLRLLNDAAKTIARTVRGEAITDQPLEMSERSARRIIGQILEATKLRIARNLRCLAKGAP